MIIAVANQKGGVGKTTLTVHAAEYLGRQGHHALVVDADPQGSASSYMTNSREINNLYPIIVNQAAPDLNPLITHPKGWQCTLIPGNGDTTSAMLAMAVTRHPFGQLAKRLQELNALCHIVLIDMPPSRSAGFEELLFAADFVLCPTLLERQSLEGVSLMANTVTRLEAIHGHAPQLLGIVPNKARRTNEHHSRLLELTHIFGNTVWPPLPDRIAVAEAAGVGKTLYDHCITDDITGIMISICDRIIANTGLSR